MRILTAYCRECGANRDVTIELDQCETSSTDRQDLPVDPGAGPLAYPRWVPSALMRCPDGHLVLRMGIGPDELPVPAITFTSERAKA